MLSKTGNGYVLKITGKKISIQPWWVSQLHDKQNEPLAEIPFKTGIPVTTTILPHFSIGIEIEHLWKNPVWNGKQAKWTVKEVRNWTWLYTAERRNGDGLGGAAGAWRTGHTDPSVLHSGPYWALVPAHYFKGVAFTFWST